MTSGEGDMDEDDILPCEWLATDDLVDDVGSSTVTTRKRELAAKNSVGELPVDEGEGEVDVLLLLILVRLLVLPVDSPTRVTWNLFREGLGTGDAMGD